MNLKSRKVVKHLTNCEGIKGYLIYHILRAGNKRKSSEISQDTRINGYFRFQELFQHLTTKYREYNFGSILEEERDK